MARRVFHAAFAAFSLCASVQAANLDLTPFHRAFQFNFGNPGARALGMGGAFIGRADDASAAEANPAGLTVISKREATLEFRDFRYSTDVPVGFQSGSTINTQRFSTSSGAKPSFFSIAAPVGSAVFAAYYARPLDFEQRAAVTQGTGVNTGDTLIRTITDNPGTYDVHYTSEIAGVAGAFRAGGLSLGATLRYQRLSPRTTGTFFTFDPTTLVSKGVVTSRVRSEGDQQKLAYSAGLKWANESETLSVGAVYKYGARYSFTECNPADANSGCNERSSPVSASFEIPSQFGAGVSFRPGDMGLTLNADVVSVRYSRMLSNFEPALFCVYAQCTGANTLGFRINDATEIHVGGEWAFPKAGIPFAVRAGWWHDPVHSAIYTPAATTDKVLAGVRQLEAIEFGGGLNAQNHVAFGLGYLGSGFELNAAIDHAPRSNVASLSGLLRF